MGDACIRVFGTLQWTGSALIANLCLLMIGLASIIFGGVMSKLHFRKFRKLSFGILSAWLATDSRTFAAIGPPVWLQMSWWKGARPTLFAYNTQRESSGWIDFDWLHYTALAPN